MGVKFVLVDDRGVQITPNMYTESDANAQISVNGKTGHWFASAIEVPDELEVPVPDDVLASLVPDPAAEVPASVNAVTAPATAAGNVSAPLQVPEWFTVAATLPDDEVMPTAAPAAALPCKVALLHSGGISSTAMMIDLLRRGCEVHPFFISMHPEAQDAKAAHMAAKSVRKLRVAYGDSLARLTKLTPRGNRSPAPKLSSMVSAVEAHIVAEGFNAIALGVSPEALDEDPLDMPPMAIQIYTWSDAPLEDRTLAGILQQLGGEPAYRQLFWRATTSCRQPVDDRDCGACDRCVTRASTFFELWSEDRTLYTKKSACAVEAFKRRLKPGTEVSLSGSGDIPEDSPAVGRRSPQDAIELRVSALRDDGTYEVQLLHKATGQVLAIGAYLRRELVGGA